MKITLEGFAGEIPKRQPRYLEPIYAESVTGARLNRGDLEPMRSAVSIGTAAGGSQKVYLFGSTWLSWATDANAVQGPVAQDRLYITRSGAAPQMLHSGIYYGLALSHPVSAPLLTALSTPDPELVEQVIYAVTWVTSLGEESTPSPLSLPLEWSPGVTVRVNTETTPPAGRLVTHKRIYRSVTSTSGATDLFFVAERPVAEANWDHDLTTDPIQEAIPSRDYDPPPSTMVGLTAMPNGIMAAFSGHQLMFCEPFIPHAWPISYRLTINDAIVGLAAFGTSLAVLTTGTPYIVQGLHPDQMAMDRVEVNLPCLAKRGIVDMGYAAVYPSTDGLVQIGPSGAQLVSGQLWTPEQWRAMQPGSFRAAQLGGRYAFSYIPAGETTRRLGFVDLSGAQPFFLPVDDAAFTDLHFNLATGRLCGLVAGGTDIVSFDDDGGDLDTYAWRSKPFQMIHDVSFGAAMIDAIAPEAGNVPTFALRVYRNGALIHTITNPNGVHRLPAGAATNWQFEIAGNHTVTRAIIAQTPGELSA